MEEYTIVVNTKGKADVWRHFGLSKRRRLQKVKPAKGEDYRKSSQQKEKTTESQTRRRRRLQKVKSEGEDYRKSSQQKEKTTESQTRRRRRLQKVKPEGGGDYRKSSQKEKKTTESQASKRRRRLHLDEQQQEAQGYAYLAGGY